jgi:hypothetical protein
MWGVAPRSSRHSVANARTVASWWAVETGPGTRATRDCSEPSSLSIKTVLTPACDPATIKTVLMLAAGVATPADGC